MTRSAHNRGKKYMKNVGYYHEYERWVAPVALVITLIAGTYSKSLYEPQLITVQAHWVQTETTSEELELAAVAGQTTPTPAPTVAPTPIPETPEEAEILAYIDTVFGSEAENAKKIAKCESGLNPNTIGDTHIMTYHSGELVGDSIGIFQVRTGGRDFNRAKANGLSAPEFRANLKDYKYNIDYAKTIHDRVGWTAWFNCMRKVLSK